MAESLTAKLAEYTAASSGDRLPEAVRERAKKVIFDEIACGYFGRRSLPGKLAADYIELFGGPAEASVLGTDRRAPAGYAALANGTAGHGEEVDGAHVVGGHPGASIVHAAVAMAERQSATGMELVNAVALGYEVGVRIVRACGGKFVVRDTKHLTSDMFYALGCTAAAGRLLGLDARRERHAFALVTFQTKGLYALYAEKDHISKSFCNGQYAFAGISAALMASVGLEGNEDILRAEHGLLDAWGAEGGDEAMLCGLGRSSRWRARTSSSSTPATRSIRRSRRRWSWSPSTRSPPTRSARSRSGCRGTPCGSSTTATCTTSACRTWLPRR